MITFVAPWRPWPVRWCAVVGCREPRAFDEVEGRNGLMRRWCVDHARLYDHAAGETQEGKLVGQIPIK